MSCVRLAKKLHFRAFVVLSGLLPWYVHGQDRPSEDELFGGGDEVTVPPTRENVDSGTVRQESAGAVWNAQQAEATLFSSDTQASPVLSDSAAPADPLRIGGTFYTRYLVSIEEAISESGSTPAVGFRPPEAPGDFAVSLPSLLDLYLDARPNDRVRAMAIGRLQYNPAASASMNITGTTGSSSSGSVSVALNQLWLRFDIARTVFLTLGRQQIKWGTGRFWNPTDFLQPQVRDPLEPFDARLGVPMIKLHFPWEQRGWNLYAVGVLEGVSKSSDARMLGAALRGEVVLGTAELGVDAVFQGNRNPRFGADLSAGLGPFDVYGELALKKGHPELLWRANSEPASDSYEDQYELYDVRDYNIAGTVGSGWSQVFNDNDTLNLGVEFFYNSLGYEDAEIYPWLIQQGDYKPLYVGKYYMGVFANVIGPGKFEDLSLTASTLGNLSDGSFVSRLDISSVLLTHVRLETYAAANWGTRGGEFHFGLDDVTITYSGISLSGLTIPAPLFQFGVSLRMSI